MKFIDIIFNKNGNIVYQDLPEGGINQYATDYQIRVSFEEDFNQEEISYISAVIKTNKHLPERVLYIKLNGKMDAYINGVLKNFNMVYTYDFTFFDTQFYQSSLELTVNVKLKNNTEFNSGIIYIPMNKAEYSKPIVQPLDYDSTLNNVLKTTSETLTAVKLFIDNSGSFFEVTSENKPETVILRDEYGVAKIESPLEPKDIANKEYVDRAIESSHMINITQMSTTYYNEAALQGVIPKEGNGARYLVYTDGKLPIFYYSYNANNKTWEKGYQIKGSTIFLNLENGRLYRYTNSSSTVPYPNFIELTLTPTDISSEYYNKTLSDEKFLSKYTETSGYPKVYGVTNDGAQTMVYFNTASSTNTLAMRGVNGVLEIGEPTADNHASTKKYVDTKIAELVDSSPETLNTLNELAAALGDDPNFATTISNQLGVIYGAIDNDPNFSETINAKIDAVDNHKLDKVDKDGTKVLVYTNNDNNTESTTHYLGRDTASYKPYNIAMIYGSAGGTKAPGTGYLITNDPVNDFHCSTKKYVDETKAQIINYSDSKYMPKKDTTSNLDLLIGYPSGTTSPDYFALATTDSGSIEKRIPTYRNPSSSGTSAPSGVLVSGNPTQLYHAANKKYVDDLFHGVTISKIEAGYGINIDTAADGLTHTISVTDEIANKLDKQNTTNLSAYTVENGEQKMTYVTTYATAPWSIALRGDKGTVGVGTPTEEAHATTKKYVDDGLAGKVNKLTGISGGSVICQGTDGANFGILIGTSSAAQNTIARRTSAGNIFTATPTEEMHAANKKYVDDSVSTKQDTLTAGNGISITDNTISSTIVPTEIYAYRMDLSTTKSVYHLRFLAPKIEAAVAATTASAFQTAVVNYIKSLSTRSLPCSGCWADTKGVLVAYEINLNLTNHNSLSIAAQDVGLSPVNIPIGEPQYFGCYKLI